MKNELPLEYDPLTGKTTTFHILPDDTYAVETKIDVEPIIEESTAIRNSQPDGWKGREHLVAQIPMPVWQLLRETWRVLGLSTEEKQAALKRFLNDPDYAKYRTKRGRI